MATAVIFIGRPGSGKGTQVELLKEKFLEQYRDVSVIATGHLLRHFSREPHKSGESVRVALSRGERLPDFLAIKMWADAFIGTKEIDVTLFDGAPRSAAEAVILDGALSFYGINDRTVIYLDIPVFHSEERLRKRARADDLTPAARAKRLAWFDTDVVPALTFFQSRGNYQVFEIDGTPSIEEIHQTICKKLQFRA